MASCRQITAFALFALLAPLALIYGGVLIDIAVEYASEGALTGRSTHKSPGHRARAGLERGGDDRAFAGSRNLLFYDLAECVTCNTTKEVAQQSCINFGPEMRQRIAATTLGSLVVNPHQWNLLWICRPFSKHSTGFAKRVGLEEGRFHATLEPGRLVNYVPPARSLVSPKRSFCRIIRDMWGDAMGEFFPPCFLLPEDKEVRGWPARMAGSTRRRPRPRSYLPSRTRPRRTPSPSL